MSRSASPLRDRLIFVVGARRSGTNWLQRVVGSHPDVVSVPSETNLFSHGLRPLVDRFHHGLIGSGQTSLVYIERERLLDALRAFCDDVFEGLRDVLAPDADRILERTPDHVRHLDLIGDVYPDARILHIVRDGRDVARSLRSQPWGPSSISEAAEEWRSAIEAARSAAPRLEHYVELRYEELLRDPRAGVEHLFDRLGLDGGVQTVESALTEAEVRFNVDPQSPIIGKEKWREEFTPDEVAEFERVAGSLLAELGYMSTPAVSVSGTASRAVAPSANAPPRRPVVVRVLRAVLWPVRVAVRPLRFRVGRLNREMRGRQRRYQIVVDRFLDALARAGWDEVESLLRDSAHVRIVQPGSVFDGRGAEACRKLIDVLAADPARTGQQVRGDVHPALPTFTIVAAYRLDDGSVLDRVMTLTVEPDERIGRVSHYSLDAGVRAANT